MSSTSVGISRDEIVTTTPSVAIEPAGGATLAQLGRAVSVRGVDGKVAATRAKNSFRWRPLAPLGPGRHVLTVEPMTDARGRVAGGSISIPFVVVDTPAKVPSTLRIESLSRVRLTGDGPVRVPIDEPASGEFIDFIKAEDRRTRRPVEMAVDQNGTRVDGNKILAAAAARLSERTGGLHPTLFKAVTSAKRGEKLRVDVWVRVDTPKPRSTDRPRNAGDVASARRRGLQERKERRIETAAFADSLGQLGEVVEVSSLAPIVTIELPADRVKDLARFDGVVGLFLRDDSMIEDLETSIAVSGSGAVHSTGETGSGINVAVWESGPTSTADLPIAGRFEASPATSNHSQNVHAIVANTERGSPDGHAPDCNLHSANSGDRNALTWAVADRECTVINQSFHRRSEPASGALSGDDIYGDYLALNWPFPTIVHAAGNFFTGDADNINPPSSEFVNHKGYNTISVGSHNDDASAMAPSSVFRNPTSARSDRELPEISANGTGVLADSIGMSGTSMASPAVAGITALIQGTDPALPHWPEACRAILTASATRNIKDSTWWQDVQGGLDASDGTGAVNAAEGHAIAQHQRWRDAPATRRGWDAGILESSDFDKNGLSTFRYQLRVPSSVRPMFGPRRVKVALCWTSSAINLEIPLFSVYRSSLTVDLDLKVFDSAGNQVAYSGSWDNSYEIAEFLGNPGETYEIRVRRWSGTDSTWCGVAWTVTGGLRLLSPLNLSEMIHVIG